MMTETKRLIVTPLRESNWSRLLPLRRMLNSKSIGEVGCILSKQKQIR